MAREIVDPTPADELGYEHHPAWATIGASRGQVMGTGGGAVLFDSDVRHQNVITVRVMTAGRKRDLSHDHIAPEQQIVEVVMSEAQWASFVSSMNTGNGVPCTLLGRESDMQVPGMPYAPRLQESMDEVRGAADRTFSKIQEAFEAYDAHRTAANRRALKFAIKNATANVAFTAKSLNEHTENVVNKARADVEAMVAMQAQRLGLDPAELGHVQLTEGGGGDVGGD
jgi:hypothetical protein